jgi:hypothetical protein
MSALSDVERATGESSPIRQGKAFVDYMSQALATAPELTPIK